MLTFSSDYAVVLFRFSMFRLVYVGLGWFGYIIVLFQLISCSLLMMFVVT